MLNLDVLTSVVESFISAEVSVVVDVEDTVIFVMNVKILIVVFVLILGVVVVVITVVICLVVVICFEIVFIE